MQRFTFLFALVLAQLSAAPAQRIVSTTPSITEILYALGLGDRVVGVTKFCNYPKEAQSKPKIGDYINPNLEAITALKPDLVIIQTNPVRLAERLGTLHLRTLEVNQDSVAAIYRSIRAISAETGVVSRGESLIVDMTAKLDAVRLRSSNTNPVRVMFVVGRAPNSLDGLIVAAKASYLSELIALAGGKNIFADAVATYPQVSLEEVLARRPEVIIDFGDMAETGAVINQHKQAVVSLWGKMASVPAVKNRRVHAVAADIYVVPGPRAVLAAQAIFDMLHPLPMLHPEASQQ